MFRGKIRTIHFVGIGGIGMSGIAEVLHNQGFEVTGSDLGRGASVKRLERLGVKVSIGHDASNVGRADVVVRSTAVPTSNVEIVEARRRLIPVIRRAEMLAELMRLKHGIAIAGTHGKTTTTSMLATLLYAGGLDPTVVIGGRLDSLGGTNAKLGRGDYLVAEADESDGSFLHLAPAVGLVTNVDAEHLDHHGSFETLRVTFLDFLRKVPFYGFAVLCADHPVVRAMIPEIERRVVTYGFAQHADYRASGVIAEGLHTTFRVHHHDQVLGEVRLGMPGQHNVSNALGAIAVALELEVSFEIARQALDGFTGIQRRFTVRGEADGVLVVDDYGHHPIEIEATLRAAEEAFPERRIVAVFQPHRYSRVHSLWDAFCAAFNRANEVVVCPIYGAGEPPMPQVDHHHLGVAMRDRGHRGVEIVDDLDGAVVHLQDTVRAGDVVITLGAGNVNVVCDPLVAHLEAR
ncbi:MAG: UDP-N-acetylmuramate--L-alanine ligase [Deltaproteobacteria bacterium]|nr:MAG: UDP-N-acetylmuramate--L-alanine ligase [Deltaproteobacteria bacterium]